ncbi:hypothetical protein SDC9_183247 [bioreactor metagenome]|uniref:Uncharacterized protein n=1 Tax=bioreactor metagenome TaxID=1076179 RepID=A0A645H9S4_9ZZZZ
MPGAGSQYDLDGDGRAETLSNAGSTLFPEDVLYEWHVRDGTVESLHLTEGLDCDTAYYDPVDNLIHTCHFIYDSQGGVSSPAVPGPVYRYAGGKLTEVGR